MKDIIKLAGLAFAGGMATFAVLLLAKPVYDAFKPLAEISAVPTLLLAGLFLLAIAAAVFQRIAREL